MLFEYSKILQGPGVNAVVHGFSIKVEQQQLGSLPRTICCHADSNGDIDVSCCACRVDERSKLEVQEGQSLPILKLQDNLISQRGHCLSPIPWSADSKQTFAADSRGYNSPSEEHVRLADCREKARAQHNRAVGLQLVAIESGWKSHEGDAALFDALLSELTAERTRQLVLRN